MDAQTCEDSVFSVSDPARKPTGRVAYIACKARDRLVHASIQDRGSNGLPQRLKTHHQRLREQRPQPSPRPSSSSMGYDRRWRRLRSWFLARHPLCEHCKREGRLEPANEVDHITPLRWGGARLDQNNLQALCKSCHSKKTAREQGEPVDGSSMARRRADAGVRRFFTGFEP